MRTVLTEENCEVQSFKVLQFFRQHPGLVVSLSYVLLTICGIFYSWSFYKEFDVAILKLANISDILTAGVSEPAAILMFLGGLLVAAAAEFVGTIHTSFTRDGKPAQRVCAAGW